MFVLDLDLAFGRMDVDVDIFRGQENISGEERRRFFGHDEPVDLIEVKRNIFVLHGPVVDEDELHVAPRAFDIDIAQDQIEGKIFLRENAFHLEHIFLIEVKALRHAAEELLGRGQVDQFLALMGNPETDLGIKERVGDDRVQDLVDLGRVGLQEFFAGRRVVEKFLHLDLGAMAGHLGRLETDFFSAAQMDLPSGV